MKQYMPWLGGTILALVALGISIPPIIDSWPRWALLAIGVLILVAVTLTFPRDGGAPTARRLKANQKQRSGKDSRNIQAAGDVTLHGGMGDQK